MSKIILKTDFEIKKAAEKKIELIKIKNINNNFFSELDLIEESEIVLKSFIEKKDNIIIKMIYKILSILKIEDEKEINEKYKYYFNERLFLVLKENVVMKEVDRLYNLYLKGNLNITFRDIEYIMQNKEIILYLKDKKVYNSNFFKEILKRIENNELSDLASYGNGRIKKAKRELKEVI